LLIALGDPVRQQMLVELVDSPGSVASLARDIDAKVRTIRRHMKVLLANDAVEACEESDDPDETRYRPLVRPFLDDAHWRQLPPEQRRALIAMTLRRISEQVTQAVEAHGFDHEQTHVSFMRMHLDERGWQEMADLLAGVIEEAMQIEADCAGRRIQGSHAPQIASKLAILHFGRS
jgi:DNA-binding transcriptional ArsR family regulator